MVELIYTGCILGAGVAGVVFLYTGSNAYVRGSRRWLFSVSETPDAVSRVHVDLACNSPLVVV